MQECPHAYAQRSDLNLALFLLTAIAGVSRTQALSAHDITVRALDATEATILATFAAHHIFILTGGLLPYDLSHTPSTEKAARNRTKRQMEL